jgi:endo-beta-N-acetylglucosaminidase D
MNLKRLLLAVITLFTVVNASFSQRPYANCWHPDDIKDWTPESDPYAKLNRSTVKLQTRFKNENIFANPNQHYEGQLTACLTMNPMCSKCPIQGNDNFIGYNPTYWQYMDLLVWWAGSAGEGIIIPPSAPVIDAAHMSGVKVLGQLFFPPGAFGGKVEWVEQMSTKEGDIFPYAKKMYEIAKYYGFDGWFINKETGGYFDYSGFMNYYLDLAEADGLNHEMQYYDAGHYLTAEPYKRDGISYFANYGSPSKQCIETNKKTLIDAGCTEEQYFKTAYFGIECAQGGVSGNGTAIKTLFPADEHVGSIDLFCPEEHSWKDHVKEYWDKPEACGEKAYEGMKKAFNSEARFWVNPQHDPSDVSARSGMTNPGFANCLAERSTIQNLPFVTTFSAGLGKARYVNGENKGTHDWYHRGMQTIMPTWRWWVENNEDDDLAFELDWDKAYNMGTSIKVTGQLDANTNYLARLYKTQLNITSGAILQLIYQTNQANSMQIKLATADDINNYITFEVTSSSTKNGWSIANIDLSSLSGKTLAVIALNFTSSSAVAVYETSLGQLAVYPANYTPNAVQVSELSVVKELTNEPSDICLMWEADLNNDFDHFDIYLTRKGEKKLVGQTRELGFYLPKMQRDGIEETSVTVTVVPVSKNMQEGIPIEKKLQFPAISLPEVSIKASKTLVKVDEELIVEALANNYPENYEWVLPQGASLVNATNNKAVIKFTQQGYFNVGVKVTNVSGTITYTANELVEVSNTKNIEMVSVGANIVSETGHFSSEKPANIVDGNEQGGMSNKWCYGGLKAHTVVLDLKRAYQIYRFKWFDCKSNEGGDNARCYRIELSTDLENWTEVLDVKNAGDLNVKDDYIKGTVGQYVRFTPYDEDHEITIRIWEFEVFGIAGELNIPAMNPVEININETTTINIPYVLGADQKAENFNLNVEVTPSDLITLESVTSTNNEIQLKVKAKSYIGNATAKIKLKNDIWPAYANVSIRMIDPESSNLIADKIATLSYPQRDDIYAAEENDDSATEGAVGLRGVTDNGVNTWYNMPGPYGTSGWGAPTPAPIPYTFKYSLDDIYDLQSLHLCAATKTGWGNNYAAPDTVRVAVSTTTDEASEYHNVLTFTKDDFAESSSFQGFELNKIIASEGYTMKHIQLTLVLNTYDNCRLADLKIIGKKHVDTGVNTTEEINPIVTPNPVAKGQCLSISAPVGARIELVSLQGVVLNSCIATQDITYLSVQNMVSGHYLVKVYTDKNTQVAKVLVK